MNARQVAELLKNLLDSECEREVRRVQTFREADILTLNEGLVVRFEDGSEFQLEVMLTREADGEEELDDDPEFCSVCGGYGMHDAWCPAGKPHEEHCDCQHC